MAQLGFFREFFLVLLKYIMYFFPEWQIFFIIIEIYNSIKYGSRQAGQRSLRPTILALQNLSMKCHLNIRKRTKNEKEETELKCKIL